MAHERLTLLPARLIASILHPAAAGILPFDVVRQFETPPSLWFQFVTCEFERDFDRDHAGVASDSPYDDAKVPELVVLTTDQLAVVRDYLVLWGNRNIAPTGGDYINRGRWEDALTNVEEELVKRDGAASR